jgi:rifampicin phosphotransferase
VASATAGSLAAPGAVTGPPVIDLASAAALDPTLAGSKAARLAQAAGRRLPVLPGFVITTAATQFETAVRPFWERLTEHGRRPLAVRSSSTVEDAASSSMAGRFTSVLDVSGWEPFIAAVGRVLLSARLDDATPPMAVLVQPMLSARFGGVLFGIDPITGNRTTLVVETVRGGPEALVSGRVSAARYLLDRRGRIRDTDDTASPPLLAPRTCRRLARLARATRQVFDGPQDLEWALDADGRLWLLQSRPVTALSDARTVGPVLGPGPVAETFPLPLSPLEIELWVEPLRRGVATALRLSAGASDSQLRRSPVIVTVGGRVAADLELLGFRRPRPRPWSWVDPRGPARQLGAAWRLGRLRANLPAAADELVARVDRDLAAVPDVRDLRSRQLVGLMGRARRQLTVVHGHEVLTGMLLEETDEGSAAAHALRQLARGRTEGISDAEIVAAHPSVLALMPPRICGAVELPPVEPGTEHARTAAISRREALRLRIRWLQELTARASWELGLRLAERGVLARPEEVALLTLSELQQVAARTTELPDLASRRPSPVPPLPAAFRLTREGRVVAEPDEGTPHAGRGAGGGRGIGPVRHVDDLSRLQAGEVLVVRTLEPQLAGVLPRLAGLVAETGSTLSHLAILAREFGVPTVVGVPAVTERYETGEVIVVDGTTGEVRRLDDERETGGTP